MLDSRFPPLRSQDEIDRDCRARRRAARRAALQELLTDFFLILVPWSFATFVAVMILGETFGGL